MAKSWLETRRAIQMRRKMYIFPERHAANRLLLITLPKAATKDYRREPSCCAHSATVMLLNGSASLALNEIRYAKESSR